MIKAEIIADTLSDERKNMPTKLTSSQATRMKTRVANNKLQRATKVNVRKTKIRNIAFALIILTIGGVIGATLGINNERNHNMEAYSGEAYDNGYTDAKKIWLDSVVKANEDTPINLNNISIPETGVIFRDDDKLYCSSTVSDEYNSNQFTDDSLCSNVSLRIDNFKYGELEKVIPNGGRLINNGDGSWVCSTETMGYVDKTLKECLTVLRAETFSQYNEFVNENYTDGDATARLIYVEDANYVTE